MQEDFTYCYFGLWDSNGTEMSWYVDYPFVVGTWYHIVAVYDGANVRIDINGVRIMGSTLNITLNNRATRNLHIGSTSWGVAETFDGVIDEVRVSDTAERGPVSYGNLIGYWSDE